MVLISILHKFKIINARSIFNYIDSIGYFGWFLYVLIYIVSVCFLFSTGVLNIAAGFLFGHKVGFVLAYFSMLTTVILGFFISRYFFHDYFHRKFQKSSLLKWSNKISDRKLNYFACFFRIFHLINTGFLNYLFGLTKINPVKYFLITAICIIPEVAIYVFFGSSLKHFLSFRFILAIVVLAIGAILVYIFRHKILERFPKIAKILNKK
jgi:uncharacterized membrane protein YdjX (TVP38/TMEM64 family)